MAKNRRNDCYLKINNWKSLKLNLGLKSRSQQGSNLQTAHVLAINLIPYKQTLYALIFGHGWKQVRRRRIKKKWEGTFRLRGSWMTSVESKQKYLIKGYIKHPCAIPAARVSLFQWLSKNQNYSFTEVTDKIQQNVWSWFCEIYNWKIISSKMIEINECLNPILN